MKISLTGLAQQKRIPFMKEMKAQMDGEKPTISQQELRKIYINLTSVMSSNPCSLIPFLNFTKYVMR